MPKIQILSASDVILDTTDKATTISANLQLKLQQAQAKGKNTSSLQLFLTDIQNKIPDAKKQAQDAQAMVIPLTPDGYPANKTTMQAARSMLQTARQDLQTVRIDAKKIINGLRALQVNSSSNIATPSSR